MYWASCNDQYFQLIREIIYIKRIVSHFWKLNELCIGCNSLQGQFEDTRFEKSDWKFWKLLIPVFLNAGKKMFRKMKHTFHSNSDLLCNLKRLLTLLTNKFSSCLNKLLNLAKKRVLLCPRSIFSNAWFSFEQKSETIEVVESLTFELFNFSYFSRQF